MCLRAREPHEGGWMHPDRFDNITVNGTRRHGASEALPSAATNAMVESPEHGRIRYFTQA